MTEREGVGSAAWQSSAKANGLHVHLGWMLDFWLIKLLAVRFARRATSTASYLPRYVQAIKARHAQCHRDVSDCSPRAR